MHFLAYINLVDYTGLHVLRTSQKKSTQKLLLSYLNYKLMFAHDTFMPIILVFEFDGWY